MAAKRHEFWAALQPQFRAEPDPYGLIARAAIMLEDFVITSLDNVWPGGSLPRSLQLDHARRVDLLRSLNVWENNVCEAVRVFTKLRNKVMHGSIHLDYDAIKPFVAATDHFVRALEEEEETSPVPVPNLESQDGITWTMSRHLTALLGWIHEYELEATYGKTLILTRANPLLNDRPSILIPFHSTIGSPRPQPPTFEEKLRSVSGAEGDAQYARLGSFPSLQVDFAFLSKLIEANHWSQLIKDWDVSDPAYTVLHVIQSENGLAVVTTAEYGEPNLFKRVEDPGLDSLMRLIPRTSWKPL